MAEIEEIKEQIEARVEEIIEDAEGDLKVAEANAQAELAVTAAAVIVADTHDTIEELREEAEQAENRAESQEDKIKWLTETVDRLSVSLETAIQKIEDLSVNQSILATQPTSSEDQVIQEAETIQPEEIQDPENQPPSDTQKTDDPPSDGAVNPGLVEQVEEVLNHEIVPPIRFL